MDVLLLSTYELGHQPLGLARPAAELTAAGHRVACLDLAVEPLDEARVRAADLVAISVPMHTATRLGARVARRVREVAPGAHVSFYGLYAGLHADVLLGGSPPHAWGATVSPPGMGGRPPALADSVIGGELEGPLVALADALDGPAAAGDRRAHGPTGHPMPRGPIPGVVTRDHDGGTFLGRQVFRLPRRDLLPPLDRYARVDVGTRRKLVGYVEASRGCAHRCLHCPITPVYGGRLRIVGRDAVLDDIDQLVRMGAEHITFGDPDFFNGIRHSLRIVEALHAAHPSVTFDATIKVEHILEHRAHIPTLARSGCLFVVSAVEAVEDRILAHLAKGHTAADVVVALAIMRDAGLPLRPTFVAFTPWTTPDDYLGLLDFVARHGLVRHVDPIQLAIRLLVPRGSSLLGTESLRPHLGPFDPETFSYRWAHPDPRMDALQERVAARVEEAVRTGEDAAETFDAIARLAEEVAGGRVERVAPFREPVPAGAGVGTGAAPFVPRLTEAWFC